MKKIQFVIHFALSFFLYIGIVSCNPSSIEVTPILPDVVTDTPAVRETELIPTFTLTEPTPHPTQIPTQTARQSPVCSPLHGFQIVQLKEIISNPFEMPLPGSDGGHHGVDFGFYRYGAFEKMQGLSVQSILDGIVVGVIADRPPYGNAIIIETPIDALSDNWRTIMDQQLQTDQDDINVRLYCPDIDTMEIRDVPELSFYHLYAHFEQPVTLSIGNQVDCGQQVGFVGTSGASINPHLHLETRLGPSGAVFDQMAHYITNASETEMHTYCKWRLSGQFRLIDPMELFQSSR